MPRPFTVEYNVVDISLLRVRNTRFRIRTNHKPIQGKYKYKIFHVPKLNSGAHAILLKY